MFEVLTSLSGSEYHVIYLTSLLLLITSKTFFPASGHIINQPYSRGYNNISKCIIMAAALDVFFAFRPVYAFADTVVYLGIFEFLKFHLDARCIGDEEVLWSQLANLCADMQLSNEAYLGIVCALFLSFVIIGCRLLFRGNEYLTFLFFCSSFAFYGCAGTVIRNGLGCSLFFLALCYYCAHCNQFSVKHTIIAAVLALCATQIHTSIYILGFSVLTSIFVIKNTKKALIIWILANIAALTFGSFIGAFISGYIDDERLTAYIKQGMEPGNFEGFSHSGYRWDFVLYSAAAIVFIWYVTIKKGISDKIYNIIANTYILSNAVWVLFIYAKFSDRFARLSWFLMPFVFLYPLIYFGFWQNRDKTTTIILYGQWLFLILVATSYIATFFFNIK